MAPYSSTLAWKIHGQRSLVGCSPWGCYESGTTERLHFHFSLSCIGEGNGNPLQCSCLENPRNGGAWWAAVYGVAQSRTGLKWLSSSGSLSISCFLHSAFHIQYFPLVPSFMSQGIVLTYPNLKGKEMLEVQSVEEDTPSHTAYLWGSQRFWLHFLS